MWCAFRSRLSARVLPVLCLVIFVCPTFAVSIDIQCPNRVFRHLGEDMLAQVEAQYPGGFSYASLLDAQLADIDADGDQDLFVAANFWSGPVLGNFPIPVVYQFENVGTTKVPEFKLLDKSVVFELEAHTRPNYGNGGSLKFFDIDSDGDLDVLIVHDSGYGIESVFGRNVGSPQQPRFQQEIVPGLNDTVWDAKYANFADLNGDGFPELVYSGDWDTLVLAHNGSAERPAYIEPPESWFEFGLTSYGYLNNGYLIMAQFADLDGDGDQDMWGWGELGDPTYWSWEMIWSRNVGTATEPKFDISDGQLLFPASISPEYYYAEQELLHVDMNNDHKPDLVQLIDNSAVMIRTNLGTTSAPYFAGLPGTYSNKPNIRLEANQISDGRAEVIFTLTADWYSEQTVNLFVIESEGKTQVARGPFEVKFTPGDSIQRTFSVEVLKRKAFTVKLNYFDESNSLCQSIALVNE